MKPPTRSRQHPIVPILLGFVFMLGIIGVGLALISIYRSTQNGSPAVQPLETTSPVQSTTTPMLPTYTPTASPTPTSTPSPSPTPTPTPDPRIEAMLSGMSLEELVGQTIMTGVNGRSYAADTCSLLRQMQAGAVVYRGGNVTDPFQLQAFSAGLQSCAQQIGIEGGLIIAIDHEGQYVYRFDTGVTRFPMQMAIGAAGDPSLVSEVAHTAGRELAFTGVNMVLGPVADVNDNPGNSDISTRSFGSDPGAVAERVTMSVEAYLQEGILPTLKHFPGLGSVAVDPHTDLPIDNSNLERLQQVQLFPFYRGIEHDAPVVMLSHVAYPLIDPQSLPSSISPFIIHDLLKIGLRFEGIVLTDALDMGAITQGQGLSIAAAAVRALAAGADMVLIPSPYDARNAHAAILEAVASGEIPEERIVDAARRVLRVKLKHEIDLVKPAPVVDWPAGGVLAEQVGRRAVTVVEDSAGLIPLPESWRQVLVVCPSWYAAIAGEVRASGRSVAEIYYSLPIRQPVPEAGTLRSVPGRAGSYDGVVVCSYDAYLTNWLYGDSSQFDMVRGLLERGIPTIVIALKSPYDLLGFPSAPAYLATFGTTNGQISGVADVLLGRVEASGQAPVSLSP